MLLATALVAVLPGRSPAADAEVFGGWEGDTQSQGYGYTTAGVGVPVAPRLALVARVTGSYLYYNFDETASHTDVTSPGVSAVLGPRVAVGPGSLTLVGGVERRRNKNEVSTPVTAPPVETRTNKTSAVAQALYFTPFLARNSLLVLFDYSDANRWLFGKIDAKRRLDDGDTTWSVGVDVTGQGNGDVRSGQAGGIVEVHIGPAGLNLALRAGYKLTRYASTGENVNGAFFGVDFYRRFAH